MAHLLGYARVSTVDQHPDLQLDALGAAGCYRVFLDKASGALDARRELARALDQLRPGDTLVVWKLDRLGRSLRHLIDTVGELERRGVGFRSLRESIDTTTPTGKLVFHLFGALAEFERDLQTSPNDLRPIALEFVADHPAPSAPRLLGLRPGGDCAAGSPGLRWRLHLPTEAGHVATQAPAPGSDGRLAAARAAPPLPGAAHLRAHPPRRALRAVPGRARRTHRGLGEHGLPRGPAVRRGRPQRLAGPQADAAGAARFARAGGADRRAPHRVPGVPPPPDRADLLRPTRPTPRRPDDRQRSQAAAAGAPGPRRYPPYAEIADPRQRRLAVIHLHAEGWPVGCIAGYLHVHRDTVHATLRRWRDACFAGLDDRPHARRRRALKIDLRAMATVRQLQENPALGEFRVHAALKQLGIELSPRTCGRILALNRQLYGLGTPRQGQAARALKAMPFRARRRHQYWSVDVRYLDHRLGGGDVYAISILENYSRAILASGLFRTQDTAASLLVLRAAVARYGSPDALVSDGGGIFRATQARAIYAALGITKERIDPGEPWQSYVETTFNIQRRMADWHVAQATSWPELLAAHDRWLTDDNAQPHWAHQDRPGGRRSPLEVLGWVTGTVHDAAALERVFGRSRFGRRLDLGGYARFRRWRIYGERGLAKQPAAVWLSGEYLTVAFADEPLAQYVVRVGAGAKELHKVTVLQLFETRHGSPQPFLWELGPDEWLTAIRLPPRPYRRRRGTTAIQEQLLPTAGAEQAR